MIGSLQVRRVSWRLLINAGGATSGEAQTK